MAFDAFISCLSKDKTIADAACAALEAAGIRYWIAPRDVPGGSGAPSIPKKSWFTLAVIVLLIGIFSVV